MTAEPEPTAPSEVVIEELARTQNESERERLVFEQSDSAFREVVTDFLRRS